MSSSSPHPSAQRPRHNVPKMIRLVLRDPSRLLRSKSVSQSSIAAAAGRRLATTTTTARTTTTATRTRTIIWAAGSLAVGIGLGRWSASTLPAPPTNHLPHQHLPDGQPRTCCEGTRTAVTTLTPEQQDLAARLRKIVGDENVLDGRDAASPATISYLKGARLGHGPALCIVTPRKLHHVLPVVQAVLDANATIVPQGQNTGLTGGSVPRGGGGGGAEDPVAPAPRPTVILSMKYLDAIVPLDHGKRMICFAGTGLATVRYCCCC
jgi:D-lactate dehydrogenase (quinone)